MEDYDTTFAGRAIAEFVDDLSNWYVRRSRRRFWDGDPAAFATLRESLLTVSKLLAPLTPFIADAIYENLDGSEPSVHLCDFPEPGERDPELEWQHAGGARRGGAGARGARAREGEGAPAAARGRDGGGGPRAQAIEAFEELVRDELNVKALRYVSEADELGRFELKPNYRTLGPALRQADAARGGRGRGARSRWRCEQGREVGVNLDGHEHQIGPDDVQLVLQPLDGYQVERSGTHAVALDLELDDELRREALAREIVHAVQAARKGAGLRVEDRIALTLGGRRRLLDAARAHEGYVTGETLAVELVLRRRGSRHPHRGRGVGAGGGRGAPVGWRRHAPAAGIRGAPLRGSSSWAWS